MLNVVLDAVNNQVTNALTAEATSQIKSVIGKEGSTALSSLRLDFALSDGFAAVRFDPLALTYDSEASALVLALRGRGRVVTFDEAGAVTSVVTMAAHGPTWGVEIPAGVWHSLIVDEPGTVLYEVIEGAYTPSTHKDYADWAPPEGSEEGQRGFRHA